MTYNRKFLLGLLALGFLLSCTQTPEQHVKNATVLIIVGKVDGSIGKGSGFFVERDKIVTNIHVVDSGMVFAVSRKKVYNIEKVTGYDLDRDLVVLKVSGKGTALERSEGQIGEPISVVGYPGGEYKVTKGKVHGIRKSDKQLRLVPNGFPNTSNDPVTHGNSGGPVLNSEWQVVGIATSGDEDFSYASASSALNALLDSPEENLSDWQKRNPILAFTHAAWAGERFKSKNYNEAIKGFDKAIELYPADADAYLHRGLAKKAQRDYTGAIDDYTKAIEFKKDCANAYNNRGVAKAAKLDYTGAIQDYTKAVKLKEGYATAYYSRGQAKRKSEDYAGAIQDYDRTLELKPADADIHFYRGVAKVAQHDYTGAIDDYTKAIKLKEDFATAYNNRSHAKKALEQDGDAKLDYAKAYYYWGQENSNRSNYQAAIQDFDQSIDLNPDYTTYYARGNAKQKNSDYEGAIQDYGKVIERKPDYAEAYFQLGMTHFRLDNYAVARNHFKTATEKKPKFAEAHYHLGATLHRLGNYNEALDPLSKAIELKAQLKPSVIYAKAYETRGRVQKDLGNEVEAKTNYDMARYGWGKEALEDAEYLEAIKNFDAILELRLGPAFVYNARGHAKRELGKSKAALGDLEGAQNLYQEAIEDYDKAIQLESKNASLYRSKGEIKLLHGAVHNHNDHNGRIEDYEAAVKDFTDAIEVYKMEAASKQPWEDPEWI